MKGIPNTIIIDTRKLSNPLFTKEKLNKEMLENNVLLCFHFIDENAEAPFIFMHPIWNSYEVSNCLTNQIFSFTNFTDHFQSMAAINKGDAILHERFSLCLSSHSIV